ncbi:monocarboxylate transporter 12-like isoform X1 [Ruditapes philippinarum]|uniref:monocarboxylate transporter 12-like isoform X1 n=1 Tax=Ruditapes philippinarum TaxID=129788 RepID=UPI00295B3DB0|nr:monocarboxylate transporter 12-like isoform X1 [Ruditapes philippinarum]
MNTDGGVQYLLEAGMCIQGSVFGLLLLPPVKSNVTNAKPVKDEQLQIMIETENRKTNNSCDKNDIILETDLAEVDEDLTERDYFEIEKNTEKEPKAEKCSKSPKCKWLLSPIRNMFDISLLTDVKFVIFLLSLIACHLAYSLVLNMTVDRALELGMTKNESAWLASSIGIASTIGRAVLGWFGDRQYVNKIMLVSVLLLLLGLSTMLSCFLKTFSTLVIYSSIYGFFAGGYIALCPTVLAELFSAELIARSFGLYFLFIGISSTAATPIGGFLYDTTGSYDVTFVVAGAELFTAGILIIVLRCVHVHYV